MVRQSAEVENDMNSVERVLHYATEVEQEARNEIPEKKPAAPWPSQGQIEMKDVVLKYRPGLPVVIKGTGVFFGHRLKLIGLVRHFNEGPSRREDRYCGTVSISILVGRTVDL